MNSSMLERMQADGVSSFTRVPTRRCPVLDPNQLLPNSVVAYFKSSAWSSVRERTSCKEKLVCFFLDLIRQSTDVSLSNNTERYVCSVVTI